MSLLFNCSECQRPLNVANAFAGKPGLCPACQATIEVPVASQIQANDFRKQLERWKAAQRDTVRSSDAADQVSAETNETSKTNTNQAVSDSSDPPHVIANQTTSQIGIATEALSIATGIKKATNQPGKLPATNTKSAKAVAKIESGLWYIRPPAGGQFGPADADLFNKWVKEGRVTEDCYVWCKGWPDWKLASEAVPAFSESEVSLEQNSDRAAAAAARTAYLQAKKRRTMRGVIAMIVGVIVVIALLIVLFFVIKR